MRVFSLRGEPEKRACQICGRKKKLGTTLLQCDTCRERYDDGVCALCSGKPCPKCKRGDLKDPKLIFPASLFKAIRDGDDFSVEHLLSKHRVDLNALAHENGETPLSMAIRLKDAATRTAISERLIRMGASPRCRDEKTGNTPLMNAVEHRRLAADVAPLLSISVNDKNEAGWTALVFAATGAGFFGNPKGSVRTAQQLLDMGADASLPDKYGRTALGHAMKSNKEGKNQAMVDLLQQAMINQAAFREFAKTYSYSFGSLGELQLQTRSRTKARSRNRR